MAYCDKNRMNILVCGNSEVFRGMLLGALSIVRYTERPITLFIGTMDLRGINPVYAPVSEAMALKLEEVLKKRNSSSEVKLIDFSEDFRRELIDSKNLTSTYTPYAMIRLFADRIEGAGDKLLYLDTDIMARGDISRLYDTDITDYHIAGARDYFGKFFFSFRYLNSGILLMNMKRLKEDGVFLKCRILCRDKKMLLFDQHAINKYSKKKLILNRRFNEQRITRPDTLLRHYAMTIRWFPYFHTETVKPWQKELITARPEDFGYEEIYEEYEAIMASF